MESTSVQWIAASWETSMQRYFFHLRTAGGVEVTDEDGDELPDDVAAEVHAMDSIKQLVRGSSLDWAECSFEVHNDQNRHVMTVWFKEAAIRTLRTDHRSSPDDQHA